MGFDDIVRQVIAGIASGMVWFLMAAGVSIVISGMGIINFGQGAFFVLTSFLCVTLAAVLNFWWALLLAPVIVALLGGVAEVFLLRPLYGKSIIYQLILTLGIAFIITDGIRTIWGLDIRVINVPSILSSTVNFFGIDFPSYYLFLIILSAIMALGLWLMFEKTILGMLFRAIISNREMVGNLGFNVSLSFTIMFMFGTWLSGVAGVLMAPIMVIDYGITLSILMTVIVILIIGGLTSMRGALLSSIVIGLANSIGAITLPWFYTLIPASLMIIILIVKPGGLFGSRED
jgi:branched-chain amino acid transport system permease protein